MTAVVRNDNLRDTGILLFCTGRTLTNKRHTDRLVINEV